MALLKAAGSGHAKIVDLLLKSGANIDIADNNGFTALHEAVFKAHKQCVDLLMDKGADVNIGDKNGLTILHSAAYMGHYTCVKTLLKAGVNVNVTNEMNGTAIFEAARKGHYRGMDMLIDAGADVNNKNSRGIAPLHMTAWYHYDQCTDLLLQAGADVNVVDNLGNTVSIAALLSPNQHNIESKLRTVEMLLNEDSINNLNNKGHKTVRDYIARECLLRGPSVHGLPKKWAKRIERTDLRYMQMYPFFKETVWRMVSETLSSLPSFDKKKFTQAVLHLASMMSNV